MCRLFRSFLSRLCCAFGQLVATAASSFENLFELPLSIELVRLLCSDNGTDNILEATLAGEADDALLSLASAILRAVIFFFTGGRCKQVVECE